jgi:hypothetical protein
MHLYIGVYNYSCKEIIVAGLSEDELDNRGKLLISDSFASKKIVDAELSDLAIDMRHQLQMELSQRSINTVSFSSCQSEGDSLNEHQGTNMGDNLFPSSLFVSQSLKMTSGHSYSLKSTGIHNAHGHSEDVSEQQMCDKMVKIDDSFVLSEASCLEMFQNPFDHLKLDSESVEKMAAMMIDLSTEDFIPGDKCEEKLAADECAWKKENIPPAVGPASSAAISNLDFSGIVGNGEISLRSMDVSHCGHQKKRVSVGEFFRLKSELLGELGKKSNINNYFGMQTNSPEKGHKLLPLVEVELDEDATQEVSFSNQDRTKQTVRTCKSLSFSEGRKTSLYSSEHSIGPQDTLSLSCIADILAKVDTCASPRTVVSNILKQSGLCNSKGIYPVKKAGASQASCSSSCSSISDAFYAKDGVFKDTSNFVNANIESDSQKERISILSHSKYGRAPSVDVIREFDFTRKDILNEQKGVSDSVINPLGHSDRKGKLSGSDLGSSSYDGDHSTLCETSSDGWVFTVPSASVGASAKYCSSNLKTCQKSKLAQILNEENKNNDQTFSLEDSVSAGDVLKLKSSVENKHLDGSVLCVTQELVSTPKESVDCSALVPVLKNKYPELWPQLSKLDMKDARSDSKHECHLPLHCVESDHSVSRALTESRILVQSMMSSETAVSGKSMSS